MPMLPYLLAPVNDSRKCEISYHKKERVWYPLFFVLNFWASKAN